MRRLFEHHCRQLSGIHLISLREATTFEFQLVNKRIAQLNSREEQGNETDFRCVGDLACLALVGKYDERSAHAAVCTRICTGKNDGGR